MMKPDCSGDWRDFILDRAEGVFDPLLRQGPFLRPFGWVIIALSFAFYVLSGKVFCEEEF